MSSLETRASAGATARDAGPLAAASTLAGARTPARSLLIDRTRGCAVVLMVAYHFSFDLDYFGLIHQAFNVDPLWLGFRALIISLFMGALGASLALAHPGPTRWRAFLRRQLQLGAASLLVTVGSALMFPQSYIWFGILHFAWVASVLALPLRKLGWPLLVLAALASWAGNGPTATLFDTPWLGWLGFMTHKPVTEDYVPIVPWIAPVLCGLYAGTRMVRSQPVPQGLAPPGLSALAAAAWWDRALRATGRHTLLIYLAHQPILIGLLTLAQNLGWLARLR